MALTRDAMFWRSFSEHAECSVRAAALLEEMLERPARAEACWQKIQDLEHDGDKITHATVAALHKTWITPLDRDAIHSLIGKLDDVLDLIDAAAERFTLYEIKEPRPEACELARIIHTSTEDMLRAVSALTKIKDAQVILDLCVTINKHENAADKVFRRAVARLFKERGDPLDVMMWRDIFESLESAADRLEDVANIIEGIVLEHA